MNGDKRIAIKSVVPGSAASDAGIEAGDALLSVNGRPVEDFFDYRFLTTEEAVSLEVEKANCEIWDVEIEKDAYEDIGLEFEDPLMDDAKSCSNKCIFCFIDQLPKGMRETVYFKDDDSRLSFLTGNYVTLTNMKAADIDRVVRYRMSPINVSVHTTDPELRRFMLGSRFAGDVLEKIRKLVEGGITVNAQIVLCRDINDGNGLDRTLSELTALYPGVGSISVVPVGITKWRQGLFELKPFDSASSGAVINQVEAWQEKLRNGCDSAVVYLADEFYIMADRELPSYGAYEDFPQLENGVGMVSLFRHEFDEYLDVAGKILNGPRHVSIATGSSVAGYIKEMAQELEKRHKELKVDVFPINNDFFGENVTVTGLLTGGDIRTQLAGRKLGDELLISRSMLRAGESVFLDDYTVEGLEESLGTKITAVDNDGADFIDKVLGAGKSEAGS